jgi:hypothetical protein
VADDQQIAAFIARWQAADGSERANYQLFLTELCRLLDLPQPENAGSDYVFERRVTFRHGDGTETAGFIDLYCPGAFVCEAKRTDKAIGTGTWDQAMLRARAQAESYARALPADEGRPPFLIVTDVGRSIELYAEFTRSGATYVPFPDPRSHRLRLEDLARAEIRERLTKVWRDPLALDPTRQSARVTREIAANLAGLAKSLEAAGHAPETVAAFLMRCLFTMFAEDVGLLPPRAFTDLLHGFEDDPTHCHIHLAHLWQAMNGGGYAVAIRADVLRFNGGLFADPTALPLTREQIARLLAAARADWKHVEPAIFGTLLERALDPIERHALGAQYTPRAYVERLILPTVMEPLRAEWADAQAAALTLHRQGKARDAVAAVQRFHRRLTQVRVLDPACGSGNFLYVTLEHLKRLEGEVLNTLDDMGERQGLLELAGVTVDPHQLLGLEVNPRAARVAEAVLWIGYLQWHFRTRGNVSPPEPVLRDFHNIEHRDAVLGYDRVEYVTDEAGRPVMRWDGRTTKAHPVTGEDVPDETAQVPLERYLNPRRAAWPEADFVVGNPPFIGTKRMRAALGDGYVEALRRTYDGIPDSADFVMYWWDRAAELTAQGQLRRFGLITTNSITQSFNRRIVEAHLSHPSGVGNGGDGEALSLVYAIPDHPWVDSADGAAVRIAMTVGEAGGSTGTLASVVREQEDGGDGVKVTLAEQTGRIQADLRVGANVLGAQPLAANAGISGMGVALHGAGFVLDPASAARIRAHGAPVVKPYLGGKDLLHAARERYLIDFSGLSEEEARRANPAAFQHVIDYVKPERDHNRRDSIRELWWRFGWERPLVRAAIAPLPRYIGTTETAKHRVFQFVPGDVLCDHMVICMALDDAFPLSVLSSRVHVAWALAAGGTLEDRPRYNKTRCFETFPFPDASDA